MRSHAPALSAGRRHCLKSPNAGAYNRSALPTVTVVVLTTNRALAALPGNVAIPGETDGITADSVADVTQIATIDRSALEERLDVLPAWLLAQVDSGLSRALALTNTYGNRRDDRSAFQESLAVAIARPCSTVPE
ncbi:type II toxin-antitoxin system PemK/MazF family toxin [Paraconexibacter sp. AEG42_29]|uniref:type II toxin-antitoxin system PemK/MazF family toxin n=1 Tax=Paraconexibacter sp. AEG42_29 TaxID=2997339 RepID=UPI00339D7AC7